MPFHVSRLPNPTMSKSPLWWLTDWTSDASTQSDSCAFSVGRLFLEPAMPHSVVNFISLKRFPASNPDSSRIQFGFLSVGRKRGSQLGFLSVGLSGDGFVDEAKECTLRDGGKGVELAAEAGDCAVAVKSKRRKVIVRGGTGSAINTTKHLWAGAIAAMVSRTWVAPLERLKLKYMVRGEQKHLLDLIRTIATKQGLKGFWNQHGHDLNAFSQLELGPVRTLLYGAISGACAEAATYPFEVLRRRLQLQVQATRLNTFATFFKIVEQGGLPALYAGLLPSLLQVLPSASISFFVYEFMKIVLKVE